MLSNKYSIRNNSKSFFFASIFLNKEAFTDCSNLYKFCRYVDDIVDENYDNKRKIIYGLERSLKKNTYKKTLSIFSLIKKKTIRIENVLELIQGVKLDLENTPIKKKSDLINYSYLVAGSVGIMMCDILKCKEKYAYNFAVDLGIAMQLTNIARDILEDAKIGRIYIPKSWLNLNCLEISKLSDKSMADLRLVTKRIIILSEEYYSSAMKGLAFLPLRARYAILISLKLYRQIGIKILNKNCSNLIYREKISFLEKVICLIKCTVIFILDPNLHIRRYNHKISLHKYLQKYFFFSQMK